MIIRRANLYFPTKRTQNQNNASFCKLCRCSYIRCWSPVMFMSEEWFLPPIQNNSPQPLTTGKKSVIWNYRSLKWIHHKNIEIRLSCKQRSKHDKFPAIFEGWAVGYRNWNHCSEFYSKPVSFSPDTKQVMLSWSENNWWYPWSGLYVPLPEAGNIG